MAAHGRPTLRDIFDDSPTPHIAHPPETHQRDFYVATDGSYRTGGGGLGVVIETATGDRVARLSIPDQAPDNNVAEYRALHLGLDVLDARTPRDVSVGVLVDHDELAGNINSIVLAGRTPDWDPPQTVTIPEATANHWRGIRARIGGFESLRAAQIDSDDNPAHPLANTPDKYGHVGKERDRCIIPPTATQTGSQVPPPSRARDRST